MRFYLFPPMAARNTFACLDITLDVKDYLFLILCLHSYTLCKFGFKQYQIQHYLFVSGFIHMQFNLHRENIFFRKIYFSFHIPIPVPPHSASAPHLSLPTSLPLLRGSKASIGESANSGTSNWGRTKPLPPVSKLSMVSHPKE